MATLDKREHNVNKDQSGNKPVIRRLSTAVAVVVNRQRPKELTMLATLVFGLVLIGAIAAFAVIADSGMRSWSALKSMRFEQGKHSKPAAVTVKRRSIAQRSSTFRPLGSPSVSQRAA